MVNGNSTASVLRPAKDAVLRALERLVPDASAPHGTAPQSGGAPLRAGLRRRHASGIFRAKDEFAGLERLDRAELDETDDD
jgi:hypothetical protein